MLIEDDLIYILCHGSLLTVITCSYTITMYQIGYIVLQYLHTPTVTQNQYHSVVVG